MAALGITVHQMTLPCGRQDGGFDGWVVLNEDGFSDAELADLSRLQALLVGLDRHVAMFAELADGNDEDRHGGPTLTPRERLVLDLLAAVLSAQQLGLVPTPGTVARSQP